ncbi:MBL fold metallo-hydrolase [Rhodococcus sp. NPDC127528]|uniref:MBL fold metallo-hydrolase n=1 Tax=unclassified Rhodococcus (in: high G+C Gram-positive bacteria) TaxID=192944 RepID=UPI003636B189
MGVRVALSAAVAVVGAAALAGAGRGVLAQIGASTAAIAPHAEGSARYRGRRFHNTEPSSQVVRGSESSLLSSILTRGSLGRPRRPIPLATPLAPVEAAELALTWYGHSSVLVEIDGFRVLADPVWSRRVSPSRLIGPARLHPTPVAVADLPPVDAVVISHDHYDHLDKATVEALVRTQRAPFVVPTGIGAHLRHWRVPEERIVELDWDEQVTLGGLSLTCTEARHFSGRGLLRNTTLWASWVMRGPAHTVFFGGDTGYSPRFAEIGERHGPFDLTLLPVGAYDEHWPDVHMNPEEAVRMHADLSAGDHTAGVLVPVHWATFNLAFHPWAEPVTRLLEAAGKSGTRVRVPMPGQRIDVLRPDAQRRWWLGLA